MKAPIFGKRKKASSSAEPALRKEAPPHTGPQSTHTESTGAADPKVRLAQLGEEVRQHVVQAYDDPRGLHPETVIGALAALNGEFALRAADVALPENATFLPGGFADGLLFRDEAEGRASVWSVVYGHALAAGASMDAVPDIAQIARASDAAVGTDDFPHVTVPRLHFPHEWSPAACVRLRGFIQQVAERETLTPHDTCGMLAFALGLFINESIRNVPDFRPEIALRLAAEMMAGTARMAPLTEEMTPAMAV